MAAKFEVISFSATDGLQLQGLLSMPKRAKGVCIFLHGLTSDALSETGTKHAEPLHKAGYGMFTINTRGAGIVSSFEKQSPRKPKEFTYTTIGTAYENFTECVHDIQGAIDFLKTKQHKHIFLIGSSTGCQKIIYYLAQNNHHKHVSGAILLAPLSDYAVYLQKHGKELAAMTLLAKTFIKNRKGDTFMPGEMTDFLLTAKRFYSLTSPKSAEEIFTYASTRKPKTLQQVKTPMLTVIGDSDEYLDRPALELVEWFETHISSKKSRVEWIEGANHGFDGKEKQLGKTITDWIHGL